MMQILTVEIIHYDLKYFKYFVYGDGWRRYATYHN